MIDAVQGSGGCVVSADGTAIAFDRVGDGPAVVIVHGGLGTAGSWRAVAERLADRHECLLVERRGRGRSDRGAGPYSLAAEAADVRAVLAVAGAGATLIGHSYGGTVALEVACTSAPDELGKLVLYEPAGPSAAMLRSEDAARLQALAAAGRSEETLELGLDLMAAAGALRPEEVAAARAARPSAEWSALASLGWTVAREMTVVAANEGWHAARFARILAPTLLIVGELSLDPHQAAAELLAAALPDARVVRLERQGHVAHLGDPDGLARAVAAFLDR